MQRILKMLGSLLAALLLGTALVYAQVGGGYDLSWSSVDGGGATFSTGGSYSLGGTIGQPDAGTMAGGAFTLDGGFWGAGGTPNPTPTATRTATNTPTPLPTQTPGGPSATPIPSNTPVPTSTTTPSSTFTLTATTPQPTDTPSVLTVTPTACPLQFEDVQPDHTFYTFVRCMVCQGIVNGYPCGGPGEPCVPPSNNPYFRPGNLVTRGQIAKIVSNSAGFYEPVSGQIFEDVLPGSTFYDFVGRLVTREVMSGYPCGGPGEPCVPPDNRPYFRSNAAATRGQISKIVSNAAGFQEPVSSQTFEDVPATSTFYAFIERLFARGVINGYPCGGAGEPCVPPENRPYFRPAASVTRGQTTKIVSNTFFPGCDPLRQ